MRHAFQLIPRASVLTRKNRSSGLLYWRAFLTPTGMLETALERGVRIPESNGAGQRARTRPHRMTIVAAVHDPLAIFPTDDFSDVVTPHHDGAHRGTARVGAVMRP